jgi:hypothetical protein
LPATATSSAEKVREFEIDIRESSILSALWPPLLRVVNARF